MKFRILIKINRNSFLIWSSKQLIHLTIKLFILKTGWISKISKWFQSSLSRRQPSAPSCQTSAPLPYRPRRWWAIGWIMWAKSPSQPRSDRLTAGSPRTIIIAIFSSNQAPNIVNQVSKMNLSDNSTLDIHSPIWATSTSKHHLNSRWARRLTRIRIIKRPSTWTSRFRGPPSRCSPSSSTI